MSSDIMYGSIGRREIIHNGKVVAVETEKVTNFDVDSMEDAVGKIADVARQFTNEGVPHKDIKTSFSFDKQGHLRRVKMCYTNRKIVCN